MQTKGLEDTLRMCTTEWFESPYFVHVRRYVFALHSKEYEVVLSILDKIQIWNYINYYKLKAPYSSKIDILKSKKRLIN